MNYFTPILASSSFDWVFWVVGAVVFIIIEIIREIICKAIKKPFEGCLEKSEEENYIPTTTEAAIAPQYNQTGEALPATDAQLQAYMMTAEYNSVARPYPPLKLHFMSALKWLALAVMLLCPTAYIISQKISQESNDFSLILLLFIKCTTFFMVIMMVVSFLIIHRVPLQRYKNTLNNLQKFINAGTVSQEQLAPTIEQIQSNYRTTLHKNRLVAFFGFIPLIVTLLISIFSGVVRRNMHWGHGTMLLIILGVSLLAWALFFYRRNGLAVILSVFATIALCIVTETFFTFLLLYIVLGVCAWKKWFTLDCEKFFTIARGLATGAILTLVCILSISTFVKSSSSFESVLFSPLKASLLPVIIGIIPVIVVAIMKLVIRDTTETENTTPRWVSCYNTLSKRFCSYVALIIGPAFFIYCGCCTKDISKLYQKSYAKIKVSASSSYSSESSSKSDSSYSDYKKYSSPYDSENYEKSYKSKNYGKSGIPLYD